METVPLEKNLPARAFRIMKDDLIKSRGGHWDEEISEIPCRNGYSCFLYHSILDRANSQGSCRRLVEVHRSMQQWDCIPSSGNQACHVSRKSYESYRRCAHGSTNSSDCKLQLSKMLRWGLRCHCFLWRRGFMRSILGLFNMTSSPLVLHFKLFNP